MTELDSLHGSLAAISPIPSPSATPAERKARGLLARHTPVDTDEVMKGLLGVKDTPRGGEWYFLMGVCALRQGFLTDAQAHLDHACTLGHAEAVAEYRALYEEIRRVFEKRKSDEDSEGRKDRDHACFSAADCCDCFYCCDCDGDGVCCDGPDGCCDCCDCSDGCN